MKLFNCCFSVLFIFLFGVSNAFACPNCPSNTSSMLEKYSDLSEGTILTNQAKFFDVSATGGSGDAMIFDSNCSGSACSGDDSDLGVWKGNLVIISEDGDTSDPDDAAGGGVLTFTFRQTVKVRRLLLVDVEEGARVKAFHGTNLVFNKYVTSYNKGTKTVYVEHNHSLSDVDKVEVHLNGSGAVGEFQVCTEKCSPLNGCNIGHTTCQPYGKKGELDVVLENQRCNFKGYIVNTNSVHLFWPLFTIEGNGCFFSGEYGDEEDSCSVLNYDVTCYEGSVEISAEDSAFTELLDKECESKEQICIPRVGIIFDFLSDHSEGTTDLTQCELDCLGVPGGTAVIDDCGVCDGNNQDKDECGVCFGNGPGECGCDLSIVKDDCGVCGGNNQDKDECGVCFGDGTSCEMQVCYLDWNLTMGSVPDNDPSLITIKDYELPTYKQKGMVGSSEDCDLVTICYKEQTIQVAKLVLPIYIVNGGATEGDCVYEYLEPTACASANGFLNQVNIASVINLKPRNLFVTVEYTDLLGVVRGTVSATIKPNLKRDFIVNDLGLEPDTYGTVCVHTDAVEDGSWRGGVALYKANERPGAVGYDFALYYPFTNPRKGPQAASLNTFHLGASSVADWVRVTDAVKDNKNLQGTLLFFDQLGNITQTTEVNLPDGGRFDFSGHEAIGNGLENREAVGMVKFIPKHDSEFYFTTARYFYDCPEPLLPAGCNDFLSAFIVPNRPPHTGKVFGTVSTSDDILSIIELNNFEESDATARVDVYDGRNNGEIIDTLNVWVPANGSIHLIMNPILGDNEVGAAVINSEQKISALSLMYRLEDVPGFVLDYGYSTQFTGLPGEVQLSEFNSYLGQRSISEIFNTGQSLASVTIDVLDFQGNVLANLEYMLDGRETLRFELPIPVINTYGTLIVQGKDVLFRNFVVKDGDYVLPFIGQ